MSEFFEKNYQLSTYATKISKFGRLINARKLVKASKTRAIFEEKHRLHAEVEAVQEVILYKY